MHPSKKHCPWTHFLDLLRSDTLKNSFTRELEARKTNLSDSKAALEALYAQKLDDTATRPDLVEQVNTALRTCEAAMTSYNGTVRSIKLAVESWLNNIVQNMQVLMEFEHPHAIIWVRLSGSQMAYFMLISFLG